MPNSNKLDITLLINVISNKYPPRNRVETRIQIRAILAYSAKKKNTNITAACSVIKPLTSSDSASARSKGALFVSAIDPIKKTIKIGSNGAINHTAL
jgi:hypothetical protein